nr:hypothetical protein [Candidatus Sigynarchaeota archaeon]
MEIPLDDLGKYLDGVLAEKFKKLRKIGKKMIDEIGQNIRYLADEIDRMGKKIPKEKDDLVTRAATRFVKAMQNHFKEFESPGKEQITHSDLKSTFDFLSSLFTIYNENGRKWIPKFGNDYKEEIKAIQKAISRIFTQNGELDHFIREKYGEAKDAEDLKDRIKRIDELIDKYKEDRKKIDELTSTVDRVKKDLVQLENQLIDMEHDPQVEDENRLFREENNVKQQIQLELSKIKKSAKKFEKALETGSIEPRFITKKEIKDYFKNSFESLIVDGPDYPKLRAILENMAGGLDEEEIQLKEDKKEKAQDIITAIKDQRSLKPLIETYTRIVAERKGLNKAIQEKGTSGKIAAIKQKISDLTTQKGHTEADLGHEKENVVNSLNKMKSAKEDLENEVQELSREKVTIMLAI